MAARERKYAGLPDMDDAPDIYETPELTDDISTVPTTTAHTQSDDEFFDVEDETQPISRSRLRINEARSRFTPASIDAHSVDFSDRVDGKRKSYKASSRRQRILQDGTEELGDLSDDDDEESLERRIARLKREVEETKDEFARRQASAKNGAGDSGDTTQRLDSLSQALLQISQPLGVSARPTQIAEDNTATPTEGISLPGQGATYTIAYAPSYEETHALAKAADFDRRLLDLEKGLGLSSASIPGVNSEGIPRAILPTLESLDKQVSTLSQATTANLDAITRRVRTLVSEQEKLNESREKAKTLREELGKHASGPAEEESDQDAKINSLYAILPTIENLAPILPPLLDRLRSLKTIHADAAAAGETLTRIEKEQADMAGELKQWRAGIEKMENTMKQGEDTVKNNVKVMEGWVKDLEQRMSKLG